ncbi:hypothetical protein [Marinobacter alexandrii]|uniref:hypothetical protein n=1 Tax=Marinobacter alexandrii TaxID=2570351 RepID=UPI001109136D|nr:hypothetical protein [Marinobacter alexandrii]
MTIGQTRTHTKHKQSAQINQDIERFLSQGGQIKQLNTQRSEFQPTWKAYAESAFEEREHEKAESKQD